jgi:hypothetical protein
MLLPRGCHYEKEEAHRESARLSIVLVYPRPKLSLLSSTSAVPSALPHIWGDKLIGSANGIGDPEELKGE